MKNSITFHDIDFQLLGGDYTFSVEVDWVDFDEYSDAYGDLRYAHLTRVYTGYDVNGCEYEIVYSGVYDERSFDDYVSFEMSKLSITLRRLLEEKLYDEVMNRVMELDLDDLYYINGLERK